MPRINGVMAILRYLGFRSRKAWPHLRSLGVPHYRSPEDASRVFAFTEEIDRWEKTRAKNGNHRPAVK